MIMYTPNDWYWFIQPDLTNVYSSKQCMAVPQSDQEYVAWKDGGRSAPTLDSMATLETMMAEQYPPGTLKSYNPYARFNKTTSGVVVTSLSSVPFLSDPVSRNTLANAYEYIKASTGTTVQWKMSDGTFITLNEAQLQKATTSVASFVQSCFSCESTNFTGINNGSITTIAQIDAAYAAISNVYP